MNRVIKSVLISSSTPSNGIDFDSLKASGYSDNLITILTTSENLKLIKSSDIKFSEPIIMQQGNAVIFPHTINVIQGQAGVHKSRLAEMICSAILKRNNCNSELLGYIRRDDENTHDVIYVDTERNTSEQLPFALQSIQMKAGYEREDHPDCFKYLSLLQINRKDRFSALNEYLNYIRTTANRPMFIVLDVSTDCIEDFNKTDKSLELIDLMNIAINEHNVIFLCIIHENPNSVKARGHFGTELMNKASTVMQVGFEKDASNHDTSIICVKYLKCRSTARHAPFHIMYNDAEKGLVLAKPGDVSALFNSRKLKATAEDLIEHLEMYLGDGTVMARMSLIDYLRNEFNAKDRTIEDRLKTIIDDNMELFDIKGNSCHLQKVMQNKVIYYSLAPNSLP